MPASTMQETVHHTAVIDPDAEIHPSARIGPYCVIGAGVVVGANCVLHNHVTIEGPTRLGEDNVVYPFAVLGAEPQDLKFKGSATELVVGDRNRIREHVTIHRGTEAGGGKTVVGSDCLLMVGAHIAHDCVIEDQVVIANSAMLGGHTHVEVGATIAHPHGQIYAYDHVPARQLRRLKAAWRPDPDPGERLVADHGEWTAWVPHAPTFPVAIEIAPRERLADLPSMGAVDREGFARILIDVLARLDRLYDADVPYMLWLNQRPTVADGHFDDAWFNVEIVSPWRSQGVQRFIAAAEVASEEFFNPVIPEDLAARLRESGSPV